MADEGVDADEQASILRSLDRAARKWGDAGNIVDLLNGLRASLSLDENLRRKSSPVLLELKQVQKSPEVYKAFKLNSTGRHSPASHQ